MKMHLAGCSWGMSQQMLPQRPPIKHLTCLQISQQVFHCRPGHGKNFVVAGKAARLRKERRDTSKNFDGKFVRETPEEGLASIGPGEEAESNTRPTGATTNSFGERQVEDVSFRGPGNFAVSSRKSRDINQEADPDTGPTALKYAIWITFLLAAIGTFYGLVFVASGGVSTFLKDKVTFTRKDFVPYSERRRLEAELLEREQSSGSKQAVTDADPTSKQTSGTKALSPEGLYNLLPAPLAR